MLAPFEKLTPTEELIVELLIARTRLGEKLWTFNSNVRNQIDSLCVKGYVVPLNGIVERTVRAYLTDEAKQALVNGEYMPPIARKFPEMEQGFNHVVESAQAGNKS